MNGGGKLKRVKVEYDSDEELNPSRRSCANPKRVKVENGEEDEIGRLFMGIMEGYSDSVIPALSELEFGTGSVNSPVKKSESSKRDRIKIAEKFSVLQSMVPSLAPNSKESMEKIAVEATKYIKSLSDEISRLEEMKTSRKPTLAGCTSQHRKPSVSTSVCNADVAFFAIRFPARQGLLSRLSEVFQRYHAEVFEVTVFMDDQRDLHLTGTFTIQGYVNGISGVVERIKGEILAL